MFRQVQQWYPVSRYKFNEHAYSCIILPIGCGSFLLFYLWPFLHGTCDHVFRKSMLVISWCWLIALCGGEQKCRTGHVIAACHFQLSKLNILWTLLSKKYIMDPGGAYAVHQSHEVRCDGIHVPVFNGSSIYHARCTCNAL